MTRLAEAENDQHYHATSCRTSQWPNLVHDHIQIDGPSPNVDTEPLDRASESMFPVSSMQNRYVNQLADNG